MALDVNQIIAEATAIEIQKAQAFDKLYTNNTPPLLFTAHSKAQFMDRGYTKQDLQTMIKMASDKSKTFHLRQGHMLYHKTKGISFIVIPYPNYKLVRTVVPKFKNHHKDEDIYYEYQ